MCSMKIRSCMDSAGWCPFCYEGLKGRKTHKGHYGYRKSTSFGGYVMAQYLRQKQTPGQDGMSDHQATVEDFPAALAGLAEFLTLDRWEDGKKRRTGSITVFSDEGSLKACLSDKDTDAVAFVSAPSWVQLLHLVEEGIRGSSLEWRRNRYQRKGKV